MKFNLGILAIVALSFTIIIGCTKSGADQSFQMGATVGSDAYLANNCIARPSGSSLIIQGLNGSATVPSVPYISITISHWTNAADTFKFDSTMYNSFAVYVPSATQTSVSKSGLVYVNTVNSTSISGTFNFICTDGTVVTGGTFTAKRQ